MIKDTKEQARLKFRKKEFEIKLISENAIIPEKAVGSAIGYDLCVPNDFNVPAHSRVAIPLNIAINLPRGVEGKIEPRSGFSLRGIEGYGERIVIIGKILGIFPKKKVQSGKLCFDADVCVSKIDPNYTGNIHVIVNNRDESFLIRRGTRIAQLTFYQTIAPFFKEVDELTCKSRGGWLGHTGTDSRIRLADIHSGAVSGLSNRHTYISAVERLKYLLRRRNADENEPANPDEISEIEASHDDMDLNAEELDGVDDDTSNSDTSYFSDDRLNEEKEEFDSDNYGVHV